MSAGQKFRACFGRIGGFFIDLVSPARDGQQVAYAKIAKDNKELFSTLRIQEPCVVVVVFVVAVAVATCRRCCKRAMAATSTFDNEWSCLSTHAASQRCACFLCGRFYCVPLCRYARDFFDCFRFIDTDNSDTIE